MVWTQIQLPKALYQDIERSVNAQIAADEAQRSGTAAPVPAAEAPFAVRTAVPPAPA